MNSIMGDFKAISSMQILDGQKLKLKIFKKHNINIVFLLSSDLQAPRVERPLPGTQTLRRMQA